MKGKTRQRRRTGVLVAAAILCVSALPATAEAAKKPFRAAVVDGVSVSPGSPLAGGGVAVSATVRNTGTRKLPKRALLVRLGNGAPVIASTGIPALRPGRSVSLSLNVTIPDATPGGLHVLRVCRAWRADRSRCGAARTDTQISVRQPARLAISPSAHDFGARAVGSPSPSEEFTVINTGGEPSGPIGVSRSGADQAQFVFVTTCQNRSLAPGESCRIEVAFAASSPGVKSASIHASASPGATASAAVSGTGLEPAALEIAPTAHDFGTQGSNTTSASQRFVVSNAGGAPSGTIATSLGGTSPGQYSITADTCNGLVLGAGANCFIDVAFAPTSSGTKSASVQASASPGGTAAATLAGSGQTPASIEITPSTGAFGNVLVGDSLVRTFTVTNTGEATSGTLGNAIDNQGPGLIFQAASTTCPGALAGGASCTISIRYTPPDTGTHTATFSSTASPGGSDSVSLSGSGTSTAASLQVSITGSSATSPGTYGSSASFDFPSATVAAVKVWIRNAGAADAHISNSPAPITNSNATAETFDPPDSTCGVADAHPAAGVAFTDLVIEGNTECYIDYRVSPVSLGVYSSSFTVTGSPGGNITATVTATTPGG